MGKLAAFVSMFAFIFVAMIGITFFVPFIAAFIFWDWNFNVNWHLINFFLRINILFSTFMGIAFMTSKEGKAFANDFEYKIGKRK